VTSAWSTKRVSLLAREWKRGSGGKDEKVSKIDDGVVAATIWSSLEIAKLVVAALTPMVVAAAGYWINRRLKSLEAAQWSQQKIVERRIQAYDELAPSLNRLFCFFAYVGSWKETKPSEVIGLKRSLDERAHISAPLFDADFLRLYNELLDCCFTTFGIWGEDAKLRTLIDRRRQALSNGWERAWDACFADRDDATAPSEVKSAYTNLMAYLATAMGASGVDARILGTSQVPVNYDTKTVRVVSRMPEDP
jgi:hypothetical protein